MASPQLSSIVERQGIALEALRGTADIGAPAGCARRPNGGAARATGPRRRGDSALRRRVAIATVAAAWALP